MFSLDSVGFANTWIPSAQTKSTENVWANIKDNPESDSLCSWRTDWSAVCAGLRVSNVFVDCLFLHFHHSYILRLWAICGEIQQEISSARRVKMFDNVIFFIFCFSRKLSETLCHKYRHSIQTTQNLIRAAIVVFKYYCLGYQFKRLMIN